MPSSANSFAMRNYKIAPNNPFRFRTYATISKQATYNSNRFRTYNPQIP